MSNGKHTPGPWLREGTTIYAVVQDGWRKGEPLMVNRFSVHINRGKDSTPEELEAIACLTVAAPEMYEALKQCQEYLRFCLGSTSDVNPYPAMDAALAKAEGRQP